LPTALPLSFGSRCCPGEAAGEGVVNELRDRIPLCVACLPMMLNDRERFWEGMARAGRC
jgi:hypothetical protein